MSRVRDSVIAMWHGLRWLLERPGTAWLAAGAVVGMLVASYLTGPLPRPSGPAEDDVVLRFYAGTDVEPQDSRHEALTAWNELPAQREHRVEAVYTDVGPTVDEQRDRLVLALAEDSPSDVDLVVVDNADVPRLAHSRLLRPFDGAGRDGFLGVPYDACSYRGVQWGLPLNTDAPMLVWNVDLLGSALGLTRDDLRRRYGAAGGSLYERVRDDGAEALARLRRAGDTRLQGVFGGQFRDYEGATVNLLEQFGAEGADVEGDRFLRSERSREAVRVVGERLASPGFLPAASVASPTDPDAGWDETATE